MKFLLDEKGSMVPLWAIGGTIVFLSIFWVDNVSWALLEKVKQMNHADALTRIAMIEEGAPNNNAEKLISAVSDRDDNAIYQFDVVVNRPDIKTINKAVEGGQLTSPFSSTMQNAKTALVPFGFVNKTIGVDQKPKIETKDQMLKLFKPLNIIIAVENTEDNRVNFNQAKPALLNAIRRVYQEAPDSRVSVVPYSLRVNYNNRCYTGIARGDGFDYMWWENYFDRLAMFNSRQHMLNSAIKALSLAQQSIVADNNMIALYKARLATLTPGTEEYRLVSTEISNRQNSIKQTQLTIPQLQSDIEYAKGENDEQKGLLEHLENTEIYSKFKPLALHYAKDYYHYPFLEDYNDTFANSNGYEINERNFINSATAITNVTPDYLTKFSVRQKGAFSDEYMCPSMSVATEKKYFAEASAALNRPDFKNRKLTSLEGLLWAGRLANSMNSPGLRNVIVMFTSNKDDSLIDTEMVGVREACKAIKASYYGRRATKLIFVVPTREAMAKFSRFNCATNLAGKPGYIIQDEIKNDFSEQMELNFMYLFSQESTTRDRH